MAAVANASLRDPDSRVRAGKAGEKALATVVQKTAERGVVRLGEITDDEAVAREDRRAYEPTGNDDEEVLVGPAGECREPPRRDERDRYPERDEQGVGVDDIAAHLQENRSHAPRSEGGPADANMHRARTTCNRSPNKIEDPGPELRWSWPRTTRRSTLDDSRPRGDEDRSA